MTKRTDIHRPSAINPEDYHFVALGYQKCESIEDCYEVQYHAQQLEAHRKATGAVFSQHQHGGNCHVCGAHCLYTAIFHHPETNTYIRTGMDCAEKMDMGDARMFRAFRDGVKSAMELKAGKAKTQAILEELGLSEAWKYYSEDNHEDGYEENTISDIVGKLVRYGDISHKQSAFVKSLLERIEKRSEVENQRKLEHEQAEECPTGRVKITGTVLSKKAQDGYYGTTIKMLVKDDRGFKVWGTIPSSLQLFNDGDEQRGLRRGDKVQFTATVSQSNDDPKFGFYKRPTGAKLV